MPLNSRIVTKGIRQMALPRLRAWGFERHTGRHVWRPGADHIAVIYIGSVGGHIGQLYQITPCSIVLEIGLGFPWLPPYDGDWVPGSEAACHPETPNCPLRHMLQKSIEQPEFPVNGVWYIAPDGHNLDIVLTDVVKVLEADALPWFDAFGSADALLEELCGDRREYVLARSGSPLRTYLLGYTAWRCGRLDLAATSLQTSLAISKFLPAVHRRVTQDLKAIRAGEPYPAAWEAAIRVDVPPEAGQTTAGRASDATPGP